MSHVQLGTYKDGHKFSVDVERLVETRLLIQANSGGGKSYAIRKLLEETHGKVQQIVLDIEGEFASLREHYDYLLAGKDGDIPTDPRSAELLARKLLELGADCIIDLYDLKQHERHRFVRLFLEGMMNAPKDLWHSVLVVIDEAHLFAPEKGQSEAMPAVIDLATRGRKREYVAVLATQRISKLHKDAAAECGNKLIGRTGLDIDMKRAGDELGFRTNEQVLSLRNLEPGEFYAFGPAISKSVLRIDIGAVKTPHGKAARKLLARKQTPTAKVRQVLEKLTDLPKEAEEELRDRDALRTRVRELERQAKSSQVKSDPEALERAYKRGFEEAKKAGETQGRLMSKTLTEASALTRRLSSLLEISTVESKFTLTLPAVHAPAIKYTVKAPLSAKIEIAGRTFGACERKILGFLSVRPGTPYSKVQVAAMTGYSHGSGGFNNALSNLAQAGLISRNGGVVALNIGADVTTLVDATPHSLEDWIQKLGACERKVYELLLSDRQRVFQKAEIAEKTGYSVGSGGFNNALSRLSTLGLLSREHGGAVRLNPEISDQC